MNAKRILSAREVEALEEVLEFCDQVEYRNGHTLRTAKAAVRKLKKEVEG